MHLATAKFARSSGFVEIANGPTGDCQFEKGRGESAWDPPLLVFARMAIVRGDQNRAACATGQRSARWSWDRWKARSRSRRVCS